MSRVYVSRYATERFALRVHRDGVPSPSLGPVTATVVFDDPARDEVVLIVVDGDQTGDYVATLGSAVTQTPGAGTLRWNYLLDADEVFGIDFEIGPAAPAFDALTPGWRMVVERTWDKFADLFDSPYGGPNLQVYAQTNFGRNRLADLLVDALQTLNTASSPHTTYGFNATNFPFSEWGGLLERSLYVEVLRHLIRSYVEQPEAILATAVSRLDRRDYMNRWREVLQMEESGFRDDLSKYRQANLGLGNFSVLLSGGVYGNLGPAAGEGMGMAAARGYHWAMRWH